MEKGGKCFKKERTETENRNKKIREEKISINEQENVQK